LYSSGTIYEKAALKDVNLTFKKGEFVGIVGHTGSGKSTLIQHLNGLLKPTSGTVYYCGEDIFSKDFSLKYLRSKVGLSFQYPEHQLFENTIYDDVAYGPKNLGWELLKVQQESFEAIRLVGLPDDCYDMSPFQLSGGQKRRVAIAGVLAMNPEFLVLDEPTAGLDPRGRDEILGQIERISKERGITVILVSHSMEDIARYVDRLIVVDDGEIAYDDVPARVFAHADELSQMGLATPWVTQFMKRLEACGYPAYPYLIHEEDAVEVIASWYV
jgi:energy-coupling factor transport system ATP-binding protein